MSAELIKLKQNYNIEKEYPTKISPLRRIANRLERVRIERETEKRKKRLKILVPGEPGYTLNAQLEDEYIEADQKDFELNPTHILQVVKPESEQAEYILPDQRTTEKRPFLSKLKSNFISAKEYSKDKFNKLKGFFKKQDSKKEEDEHIKSPAAVVVPLSEEVENKVRHTGIRERIRTRYVDGRERIGAVVDPVLSERAKKGRDRFGGCLIPIGCAMVPLATVAGGLLGYGLASAADRNDWNLPLIDNDKRIVVEKVPVAVPQTPGEPSQAEVPPSPITPEIEDKTVEENDIIVFEQGSAPGIIPPESLGELSPSQTARLRERLEGIVQNPTRFGLPEGVAPDGYFVLPREDGEMAVGMVENGKIIDTLNFYQYEDPDQYYAQENVLNNHNVSSIWGRAKWKLGEWYISQNLVSADRLLYTNDEGELKMNNSVLEEVMKNDPLSERRLKNAELAYHVWNMDNNYYLDTNPDMVRHKNAQGQEILYFEDWEEALSMRAQYFGMASDVEQWLNANVK